MLDIGTAVWGIVTVVLGIVTVVLDIATIVLDIATVVLDIATAAVLDIVSKRLIQTIKRCNFPREQLPW